MERPLPLGGCFPAAAAAAAAAAPAFVIAISLETRPLVARPGAGRRGGGRRGGGGDDVDDDFLPLCCDGWGEIRALSLNHICM